MPNAPSGMSLYHGELFPAWRGDLFFAALAARHVRRIDVQVGRVGEQEIMLDDISERLRDIRTGPDGALYVIVDAENGAVPRICPR